MQHLSEFINQLPGLAGIFILMLSTFLIGYFSAWWFQKAKNRKIIERFKSEVNALKIQSRVNDIETIFTEIKPKIVAVVKETQEELNETVKTEKTAEKASTTYITYNKQKPKLDFESFGHADDNKKDDLTRINGIGPYIEQKLNEIDIYTFSQLSSLKESDIRTVTELIDFFPGRIERDDWVGQAATLATVK